MKRLAPQPKIRSTGGEFLSSMYPGSVVQQLRRWAATIAAALFFLFAVGPRLCGADAYPSPSAMVIQWAGKVEVARSGAAVWDQAYTNQVLYPGDQLRTGEGARAVLRMADQTLVRVGEFSQIQMPPDPGRRSSFGFIKGILYFFHRDKPSDYEIRTRTVSAIVRGTEFSIEVLETDGTTMVSVFDGAVEMGNEHGKLLLRDGQQGVAAPGKTPVLTPLVTLADPGLIQWCLYYPGVLHLPDLGLGAEETNALAASISAYSAGDLVGAYTNYPSGFTPVTDAGRLYRAAIRLGVGKVDEARQAMGALGNAPPTADGANNVSRLAKALTRAIDVVRARSTKDSLLRPGDPSSGQPLQSPAQMRLATEWLVESLHRQKALQLENSLAAARRSVELAPDFAFGWERVAELEFGFGRINPALDALDQSLKLAPRNAQAHALRGFLLAAQNRLPQAIASFDQAIASDGNLDNAWLGRGLCYIRQGQHQRGRQDLQTAATLNPQRAVLRSYLGKAHSQEGDLEKALHELLRSMSLDESDPTAWLYSALLKQQQNQVNDAIRDLEHAQQLNETRTRGIVRSQLLLDQDRAVGGANLASVYLDAGMVDVSAREAATAVNHDYASFRSHLFLANSYNALRDPYQVNLRYETPWLTEYLLSTLLAPVGAGVLSPYVTQQEYSKLFEQDGVGVASGTEYRSNGDWFQAASQYGTVGNSSYALDATHRSLNGYRPNQDAEQLTLSAQFKQQLTPSDSVFLQGIYYDAEAGDVAQHYDQREIHRDLRVEESQRPILLAGYHHEWSERSHTLFLGGYFQDTLKVADPDQNLLLLLKSAGDVVAIAHPALPVTPLDYESELEGFTTELQQIFRANRHTLIGGARFQGGAFDTRSRLGPGAVGGFANNSITSSVPLITPALSPSVEEDFYRISAYAYDHWQVFDQVLLSGGISYDQVAYPRNLRNPPVASGTEDQQRVSPKAGLTLTPFDGTVVRAAYTRSLAGVAFDQSFRLEPVQVAGFNQAYRSIISESVVGSLAGARFETFGVALDQKLDGGTYLGFAAERLMSKAARDVGTLDLTVDFNQLNPFVFTPSTTRQRLDYEENSLTFVLNQLVGHRWAFGARYRVSEAQLHTDLVSIPDSVTTAARSELEATLHHIDLYARFNHESGFFGQFDTLWTAQSNRDSNPGPGDDFWQFNVTGGWTFFRRRLEVRTGVLNLTDRDYRLNPLNLTAEFPRERTWFAGLKFYF